MNYKNFRIEGERLIYWVFETDTENEHERIVPVEYKVCPTCQGKGTHTNPGIDSNGLPEDCLSDPDFMEDYMAGNYDVACYECNGQRVAPTSTDKHFMETMERQAEQDRAYFAECEAERRMGC